MRGWTENGAVQTVAQAKKDSLYQALLEKCVAMETEYIRIVQKLTEEDRMVVEDYIALCEETQYQMNRLAYEARSRGGL